MADPLTTRELVALGVLGLLLAVWVLARFGPRLRGPAARARNRVRWLGHAHDCRAVAWFMEAGELRDCRCGHRELWLGGRRLE